MRLCFLTTFLIVCACSEPEPISAVHPMDDTLRINHIQMLGSHNSYHQEPPGNQLIDWKYSHAPLVEQLGEQGVRQFELDLYFDRDAGRFDVLHIGLVDAETSCSPLSACLAEMRAWSEAHRGHHTVFVMLEIKTPYSEVGGASLLETLDGVVTEAMGEGLLLTPTMVRGEHDSLRDAVITVGWPTLGEGRGRFVFFLDNMNEYRTVYSNDFSSLDHRPMFATAPLDTPVAAVAKQNGPVGHEDWIREAAAQGFMIRSMTDGAPAAYAGDDSAYHAALNAGAHMLSSDFPAPVEGLDYVASIPGGTPSRCNPISAPPECSARAIEDPERLAGVE